MPSEQTALAPPNTPLYGVDNEEDEEAEYPPPPYSILVTLSSIKKEIRTEKAKNHTYDYYAFKVAGILCRSLGCKFLFLLLAVMPSIMVIVGSIYFHDCPGQPNIPMWMVVFGSVILVALSLNVGKHLLCCCKSRVQITYCAYNLGACIEGILHVFLFAWQIVGSYWVYSYFRTFVSDTCTADESMCCHPVAYKFAFASIVTTHVLVVLILATFCALVCIPMVLKSVAVALWYGN